MRRHGKPCLKRIRLPEPACKGIIRLSIAVEILPSFSIPLPPREREGIAREGLALDDGRARAHVQKHRLPVRLVGDPLDHGSGVVRVRNDRAQSVRVDEVFGSASLPEFQWFINVGPMREKRGQIPRAVHLRRDVLAVVDVVDRLAGAQGVEPRGEGEKRGDAGEAEDPGRSRSGARAGLNVPFGSHGL